LTPVQEIKFMPETDDLPDVRWLLSSPRKYEPSMSSSGILQFRHPWVVILLPSGEPGPGLNICRSFARLDPAQRGEVHLSAQALLNAAPRQRVAARPETNPRLLDAYFDPIEELEEIARDADLTGRVSPPGAPLQVDIGGVVVSGHILKDPVELFKLGQHIKALTDANVGHIQAKTAMRREIEDLNRILAQEDRQLNNHVTATLGKALTAFQKDYKPGDPQTKTAVEATLSKFVYGGGKWGEGEIGDSLMR
jgi:hypothetical protein